MISKLGVDLPHRWAGNENWKDIEVDNGEVSYNNATGKLIFWQCGFNIIAPRESARNIIRCVSEGYYLITRTSTLTGNTYTDYACLYHAKMWINPNA